MSHHKTSHVHFFSFDIRLFRQFESAILINLLIEIGRAHKYKGRPVSLTLSLCIYVYRCRGCCAFFCLPVRVYTVQVKRLYANVFGFIWYAEKKSVAALMDFIFNIPVIVVPSHSRLTFDGNVDNQKFCGNNVFMRLFDTMLIGSFIFCFVWLNISCVFPTIFFVYFSYLFFFEWAPLKDG